MGKSLVEATALEMARDLLARAGGKLVLPVDAVIADDFKNEAKTRVIKTTEDVPDGWQILDIGPATVEDYTKILKGAKTAVWNGPMGVFEMPTFAKGTNAIAHVLPDLTPHRALPRLSAAPSPSP